MKSNVNPELLSLFDNLMKTTRSALNQSLKKQGYALTPPDISVLALLERNPGIPLCQMVELTGKDKAHITRKVKELERKKLLQRHINPEDHRSFQLFLTKEGKRVQAKTQSIRTKIYEQIFANLNIQEQKQMLELMKKCLD